MTSVSKALPKRAKKPAGSWLCSDGMCFKTTKSGAELGTVNQKNRLFNTHYFCALLQNSIWFWSSLSGIVQDLFGSFLEFLAFASLAFRSEVELYFQVFVFHQVSAVGCTTAFLFTR